jgi:hypothetical protein
MLDVEEHLGGDLGSFCGFHGLAQIQECESEEEQKGGDGFLKSCHGVADTDRKRQRRRRRRREEDDG